MRIALISSFLFDSSVGGAENHIRYISKRLVAQGHEVVIFKPEWGGPSGEYTADGLRVVRIGLGKNRCDLRGICGSGIAGQLFALLHKLSFNKGAFHLARKVREFRPDVVSQHDFLSSWLSTRLLSRQSPVILTNHQSQYILIRRTLVGRILLRLLFRHYAAIIGPSTQFTPSEHPRTWTIFNGVDTEWFESADSERRRRLREKLFGSNDQFVVFCPSRWAPIKGVIYFAQALQILSTKSPALMSNVTAVFAGTGSAFSNFPRYAETIRSTLARGGIRSLDVGDVDIYQMRDYYLGSDLVVIPSLTEAVSLTALEAMACGTPVLASQVGGLAELIEDGRTGYLVPPESASELYDGLLRVLSAENPRGTIGKAAEEHVRTRFSWDRITDATVSVFCAVVAESKERP
jgi:glycosyltransferase involved in cell wall biosynthesis